jgi:Flp pilus assembly pilin Flp
MSRPIHPALPLPARPSRMPQFLAPRLRRLRRLRDDDSGMSTVEYAIGTIAAAAFAAVLYAVVSGDSIVTALTGLVERALSVTF